MTDFPYIELLEAVVEEHGECHAIVEEHDAGEHMADAEEIEVRQGTTTFDYDSEALVIEGADTTHYVHMDRVVRFYKPTEFGH